MPALPPDLLARAERLELAARRVVEGVRVGDHRSPYRGFSVDFAQHRPYVPGDDVRHIDWKCYARSDRYVLKQYEQETNFVGRILVDGSASMRYGMNDRNKYAYSALLTCALAHVMLTGGDMVSLSVLGGSSSIEVPPGGRAAHLLALARALESAPPEKTTALGPHLERAAESVARRGVFLVISDGFDDVPSILKGLNHLRFRGHDVMFLHVLHPDEIDFRLPDVVKFVDLEGDEFRETRPATIRTSYLQAFGRFLDELATGCAASGTLYQQIRTDVPIGQALVEILLRREHTPFLAGGSR